MRIVQSKAYINLNKTSMKKEDIGHFIGNPIFAIATNLDPLEKRIREKRTEEALHILNEIRSSIQIINDHIVDINRNGLS